MKKYIFFILIISSLSVKAQTLVRDDFKSGAFTLSETSVFDNKSQSGPHFQAAPSALGGTRKVSYFKGSNPYNQKMSISVLTQQGAFVVSSGHKTMSNCEFTYGLNAQNNSNNTHIDLTKYKNLNIEFDGINRALNFNITLFSYPNSAQATWGENFVHTDNTFIRTIPIAKLLGARQSNFNSKDVGSISFVFNRATVVFGGSFAVKRIWFD